MSTYRKKPVVVKAYQWKPQNQITTTWSSWPDWIHEATQKEGQAEIGQLFSEFGEWYIWTLEGCMRVNDNDWIIRGVADEIYPCKPDIFEATYEVEK